MMEKGVHKSWTPEKEAEFKEVLDKRIPFAARNIIMLLRDIFKYDQRSRAGKRAMDQARLRLITATDDDLRDMARLKIFLLGTGTEAEEVEQLKKYRDRVRV